MLSPKLLSLLATFSRLSLSRFRKFLLSPYHNENPALTELFDLIDEQWRAMGPDAFNSKQLSKPVVWKKLFGAEPYKDAILRRLASELLHLAYQFLYSETCRETAMEEKLALLRQFKAPSMDKHFRGLLRQAQALQESATPHSSTAYLHAYYLEQAQHQQLEAQGGSLPHFHHLEQADAQLDHFYYAQKLKHYCDALGYENFLSRKPEIALPAGFMDQLEQSGLLEAPLLRAYYLVAQMLAQPQGEGYFQELKQLFFSRHAGFAPEDCHTLVIHLKNYCIHKKINAGVSEYFAELFDIFKRAMDAGLLLKDGRLDPQDYKNIITVALFVQAFDWVESFIQDYTSHLPEDNQGNALAYNLAKVYFHQGQYEKVIAQLREVEYQSLVYALGSKLMLLKTYFELGEYLALDSLIESFRIYLRRKGEISRQVRQQYMNVLRFVKKLSNLAPHDRQGLAKIKEEALACEELAAKKWILEKIGEMEGG